MADSREMLKIACAALEDKKAFDIKIIDISRISTLCDYIVIALSLIHISEPTRPY